MKAADAGFGVRGALIGALLTILAALALGALLAPKSGGATGSARSARPAHLARPVTPPPAEVSLAPHTPAMPVPRSYLGLSVEYWGVPLFERRAGLFARVLSLLTVPGDGPLLLRIGGDSSDHSVWTPRRRHVPSWAFAVTPRFLQATAAVVRAAGARVLLDINLITAPPLAAAGLARAAGAALPQGSLAGLEIGNEDDIYSRRVWTASLGARSFDAALPGTFSAERYLADFRTYATALRRAAPHVPLLGPAIALPTLDRSWILALLARDRRLLGEVTAHRYPYSACVPRLSPAYPTIGRVLSAAASTGLAAGLRADVISAHRAGLPFRLSELNSITCGGRAGVSDSFATGLWASDTMLALLNAGVDGINVHVRARAVNAAFALSRHGLDARPLLYGMLLTTRALTGARSILPLRVRSPRAARLSAWALALRSGGLHVVLIDKAAGGARVTLRLPGRGAATVQRLIAASAAARSGVTLGGQHLDAAGRWAGRSVRIVLVPRHGRYLVRLPGFSAALVSLPARR